MRPRRPPPGEIRRRRRRAALTALASIAALATLAGLLTGAGGSGATVPRDAIGVAIGKRPISRPIRPGFVGLSLEYPSAKIYFTGAGGPAPNPAFLALVRGLTPGNQAPVLRIGGDTTDWTWYPAPGVPKPGGIRYTLGSAWLRDARVTAQALGARLILGVNFEADSSAIAYAESHALLTGVGSGSIAAFELGNEPEVYAVLGWFKQGGTAHFGRLPGYDPAVFVPDWGIVSRAVIAGPALAGPATGSPDWIAALGSFLTANPRVTIATYHRYPLRRCNSRPGAPFYPTVDNLLAPYASLGLAATVAHPAAVAHAHHVALRIDELNSVACRGKRGVSDTFASALWALDTLFELAHAGADGVNIHTFNGAAYEPFGFVRAGGVSYAVVRPLYYGLRMFAQAAAPGTHLVATSSPSVPGLHIWAASGGGSLRVVLINDSPSAARTVAVHPPGGAGANAALTFLHGPSLDATAGVTLGGQSFGQRTSTGQLGPEQLQTLAPVQQRYVVELPPASAALLVIP